MQVGAEAVEHELKTGEGTVGTARDPPEREQGDCDMAAEAAAADEVWLFSSLFLGFAFTTRPACSPRNGVHIMQVGAEAVEHEPKTGEGTVGTARDPPAREQGDCDMAAAAPAGSPHACEDQVELSVFFFSFSFLLSGAVCSPRLPKVPVGKPTMPARLM